MKRTSRRLLIVAVLLVLFIAAGVAYVMLAPQLVSVSPTDGSAWVPARAALRLTFSQPMNLESVKTRFTTAPERQGTFTWEASTLVFTPSEPWPAGETVGVRLDRGARDERGLLMLNGLVWSFTISPPRLAYLWPSSGQAQVYVLDPVGGETAQLTQAPNGVLDFSVSFDGLALLYSARRGDGGSDLYRVDLLSGSDEVLLECPAETCQSPHLAPDNRTLAYERLERAAGLSQVWLVNLDSGAQQLAGESGHETTKPQWASTGWLAFYDHTDRAYALFDPAGGELVTLPVETAGVGTWSPLGDWFVYPQLLNAELDGIPVVTSHLMRYFLRSGGAVDLTRADNLEDTYPVFAPDGVWLAVARKALDPQEWTLGNQLWLIRPDGSQARPLLTAPEFEHTAFAWHPSGEQVAVVRFSQVAFTAPPEIWLADLSGGDPLQLVIGGFAPQWIP